MLLWSGWGELGAVLATRQEEGETLGAAGGTELELLLHTGQFLPHPCLPAWLPWPESTAEARISFWKAVGSITSPSAFSSRAGWAPLNAFMWSHWCLQNVEPTQHSFPWWWATPEPCSAQMPGSCSKRRGWYHSDCFPSAETGQKLVKSYKETGKLVQVYVPSCCTIRILIWVKIVVGKPSNPSLARGLFLKGTSKTQGDFYRYTGEKGTLFFSY